MDIQLDWEQFKTITVNKNLEMGFVEPIEKDHFVILVQDNNILFYSIVEKGSTGATDFVDNYQEKANKPYSGRTNKQKTTKVSIYPAEGDSETLISHDYTDQTTWYQESIRVTDSILSTHPSGHASANVEYWHPSGFTNWIDLEHGLVTKEEDISSNYVIMSKKNDVTVAVEDYSVDYTNGKIIFDAPNSNTDEIKGTFSYATNSTYTITPPAGYFYRIEHSEAQFSKDIIIKDTIDFEIWVYNPNDLPNKFKYFTEAYKNAKDYINIGNLGKGFIPAFGGPEHGLQNDVLVFPFDYLASKDIGAAQGAELRIKLRNDIPLEGEFGTITLYVFKVTE